MPKVTEQYLQKKKEFILTCTKEVLKEKPLYLVNMRDIIKKADFSQGGIYRYYANVDEIYIDYINSYTPTYHLEQQIDTLLVSNQEAEMVLTKCILALGVYIEELLASGIGKTFFELMVLYAYDLEKRDILFPLLHFKQSLEYAQHKMIDYVLVNVENGVFKPQIPVPTILLFVSNFIDGIAQSVAINAIAFNEQDAKQETVISGMFDALSKAVLGFLVV